jgi:hypothetical protein
MTRDDRYCRPIFPSASIKKQNMTALLFLLKKRLELVGPEESRESQIAGEMRATD